MATAGATVAPSTYNTLLTAVLPKYWNKDESQEIIYKSRPVVYYMDKSKKREPLPHYVNIRLLAAKAQGGSSFQYYDPVSTSPTQGSIATTETVANYSWPIVMSWQEEMEYTSDEAIINRMEQYLYQVRMDVAERFAQDIFKGNETTSTNIVGLERIAWPANQLLASGSAYAGGPVTYNPDVWRLRQAARSLYGITSVAYTADETAGTGWENVSMNYGGVTANKFQYTYAYAPDVGIIGLGMIYNACTYGNDRPDLVVSTNAPYDHYEQASQTKTQLWRTQDEFSGSELAFQAMSYKGALWIRDESAKTYNTSLGSMGTGTATTEGVYVINTKFHNWVFDSRADGVLTENRTPFNQHVGAKFALYRLQQLNQNPRTVGRIFNYPVA